jgi:transcriptional regulator with XRE-family HTH domain
MNRPSASVGDLLRTWRRRRRLSQLALAMEAEVSQRHLSFVESGRAAPSREMVLRLSERLDVPMRERNLLLAAAGFAPVHPERPLDDPGLSAARGAVERILEGHEPHPALAVDRGWTLLFANRAARALMAGASPALLAAPVNVLRLSLHPQGLGPRLGAWRAWRAHVLARLRRELELTADARLAALIAEIEGYPVPAGAPPGRAGGPDPLAGVAAPFELRTPQGRLRFLTATTVFGTAVDVTLSELTVETFLPADEATAAALRELARARAAGPPPGPDA